MVDDFAHNRGTAPLQLILASQCQVRLWHGFRRNGYTPTKFLRKEFVSEIANALRTPDEIRMSGIFYAGGTATKDISTHDLVNDIKALGKTHISVEDRKQFLERKKSS